MSQENVEIVRRSWQAFVDGGLDAVIGVLRPGGQLAGDRRRARRCGRDARQGRRSPLPPRLARHVRGHNERSNRTARCIGDDRVVAALHVTGRARLSGIETELRYAVVYTVRETARSCVAASTPIATRPSKPWGWRSRPPVHAADAWPAHYASISCGISYSAIPTASSAWLRLRNSRARTASPSRRVQTKNSALDTSAPRATITCVPPKMT